MLIEMKAPQLAGLPQALDTPALTAVRVNALKGCGVDENADRVPWCDTGYYLDRRPSFTLDPAMHQGRYYVQEASSMIQRHVIAFVAGLLAGNSAPRPLAMLDACAAPGGKTTCAIESLPAGSVIVANELSPQRTPVLVENIIKHGSPYTVVTRGNAEAFGKIGEKFDIIAVDAPCSGEGMMRKEPVARTQWSPSLIAGCADTQLRITTSLWNALRPGGYMVYSTCTFNRTENESVVEHLVNGLGAEPVAIPGDKSWEVAGGVDTDIPCLRFVPGMTRGEGLFLALLRKPGTHTAGIISSPATSRSRDRRERSSSQAIPTDEAARAAGWFDLDDWQWEFDGQSLVYRALPRAVAAMAECVSRHASVVYKGLEVASVKGRKLVPSHALAMSTVLRGDAFPRVDVDRDTAVDYLRRQAVQLPDGASQGIVLLTYEGYPLGFVNNLGRRSNNLYPASWRILTTHI